MASSSRNSEPNHIGAKSLEKQRYQLRCINMHCCNHSDDLIEALESVCIYYGVDYYPGRMVCIMCEKSPKHYKYFEKKFKEGKSIFDVGFPSHDSYIDIDDLSDKEEDEAEEKEPKPSTSRVELHLDQDVRDGIHILVDQFKLCDKFNKKKIRKCVAAANELDEYINNLSDRVELLENELSSLYGPIITGLEPVDINELKDENIEEEQEEVTMPQEKINKLIEEVKTPKQAKKLKLDKSDNDDIIIDKITVSVVPTNLPLAGPLEYPVVKSEQTVYAIKFNLIDPWYRGKIKNIVDEDCVQILFPTGEKTVKTKQIAYSTLNSVRFPVGCRVIARFTDLNSQNVNDAFYAGIVAEPPQIVNNFRYLIFFDNGYVQYRQHQDIRLIAHDTSVDVVWKDVDENSQDFIKSYLEKYPERQMVKFTNQQSVQAAHQREWYWAIVLEVDASLVKLYFTELKHSEWIYRGSSRLYNIFEKQ